VMGKDLSETGSRVSAVGSAWCGREIGLSLSGLIWSLSTLSQAAAASQCRREG